VSLFASVQPSEAAEVWYDDWCQHEKDIPLGEARTFEQ